MRIALVSNFWYVRGGLERVMLADAAGLASRGHDVLPFASSHPLNEPTPYADYFPPSIDHSELGRELSPIGRAREAARIIHNPSAVSSFERFLEDLRPQIVHLHGTSRQLSPSVLERAHARGIPTVMKVADHIMRCPKAVLSRPGAPVCIEVSCAGHRFDRAIRFKCVHGSRAASAVAAIEFLVNRGLRRYERSVSLFLVPSRYLRMRMLEDGFMADQVRVEPNPIEPPEGPATPLGSDFVAYGRMVDYKGFGVVIDVARAMPEVSFVLGGDGPYRVHLEQQAAGLSNVDFVGHVEGPTLDGLLARARAVVFPSIAPEGFGMVTLEAWRAGRPVIVTDRGALPEVVSHERNGLVIDLEGPSSLCAAIDRLRTDTDLAERLAAAGRQEVDTTYSMAAHLDRLEHTYASLVG